VKRIIVLVCVLLLLNGCQTEENVQDGSLETNAGEEDVERIEQQGENQDLDEENEAELDQETTVIVNTEDVEKKYEIDPVSWRVKPIKDSTEQIVLLTAFIETIFIK